MILLKESLTANAGNSIERRIYGGRYANGKFAPGNKLNGKKGVKERLSNLRNAFIDAFEELGGAEFIKTVAKKNPKEAMALFAKICPKMHEIDDITEEKKPIVIIDATEN